MEMSKLNTILNNSNLVCRDLSNIDIIIVASAMLKICRETIMCMNTIPNANFEMKRNQYIKIFINILSQIKGLTNLDYMLDLTTNLIDNFNYLNNIVPLDEPCINNINICDEFNTHNLLTFSDIKISSFNKLLYKETYNLFKYYFDNDEQERVCNVNNYIIFLTDNLRKNGLSKNDFNSISLGLSTFIKVSGNIAIINKEKIIENLSLKYYISDCDILNILNKIFVKYLNLEINNEQNSELNNSNPMTDYLLVFEIINWCM